MVLGTPPVTGPREGDAPDDPDAVRILDAVRGYHDAEMALRKRARDLMGMNETDVTALRYTVTAKFQGETVTPTDLMNHLGVTMASVTVMIDRLERSGHLRRELNPNDRRSRLVTSTDLADDQVRSLLEETRDKMAAAVSGLTPEQVDCVLAVMGRLQAAADTILADH